MDAPIPTPCVQCGGTSELEVGAAAARLVCRYCGHVEALPTAHEARVQELSERLLRLGRARAQREAALLRYASLWQRLTTPDARRALMGTGVTLLFVALSTFRDLPRALRAPVELRAQLVTNVMWGPSFVLAAVLASLCSYVLGRRRYLREVTPLLAARAPLAPGAPLRCRVCGGPLHTPREAVFWRCEYCQSTHLLPDRHAHEHAEALGAELAVHTEQLGLASAALAQAIEPGRQLAA
ncbi:MAG: hypothetical protein RL385_6095, partial [Pseudomonadota bacterium]